MWAENLNPEELQGLRDQVTVAREDPSYTIIANYPIHWTEIELGDDEVPRIIWADSINAMEMEVLRDQVNMALMDPNFAIVTNFEIHVEGIDTIKKVEREVKPSIRLTRFQILKKEN